MNANLNANLVNGSVSGGAVAAGAATAATATATNTSLPETQNPEQPQSEATNSDNAKPATKSLDNDTSSSSSLRPQSIKAGMTNPLPPLSTNEKSGPQVDPSIEKSRQLSGGIDTTLTNDPRSNSPKENSGPAPLNPPRQNGNSTLPVSEQPNMAGLSSPSGPSSQNAWASRSTSQRVAGVASQFNGLSLGKNSSDEKAQSSHIQPGMKGVGVNNNQQHNNLRIPYSSPPPSGYEHQGPSTPGSQYLQSQSKQQAQQQAQQQQNNSRFQHPGTSQGNNSLQSSSNSSHSDSPNVNRDPKLHQYMGNNYAGQSQSSQGQSSQGQSQSNRRNHTNQELTCTSEPQPNGLSKVYINKTLAAAPFAQTNLSKENELQINLMKQAYKRKPNPADTERSSRFLPRSTIQVPDYHVHPPKNRNCSEDYSIYPAETLFFIFYYMQNTRAQIMAAKALKKLSWRFHKKYLLWFQRKVEPTQFNQDFEIGDYIYFDITEWEKRTKNEFKFEYEFLEDRDLDRIFG